MPQDTERELGQFIPLHYHYVMLQDTLRVSGFQAAIQARVRVGMRVVELGGGTGILSFLAAKCGARVQCVERNPALVETATRLLADNGVSKQVDVIQHDASTWVPESPVDVVVCEMLHVAMLREKQLEVIAAFKENYRAKFGDDAALPVFVPEASVLMVQAVEHNYTVADYYAPVPVFQALDREHESTTRSATELLPYSVINYDETYPTEFDEQLSLEVNQSGRINALRFITQNALAVDVEKQAATSWPNQALIMPLEHSINASAGDQLEVGFAYHAGDSLEQLAASIQCHHQAAQYRRAA
ncbi:MAG: hypothetical protein Aurels2KO_07080 [Aureliella sp.]